jgi:hypothetical protein
MRLLARPAVSSAQARTAAQRRNLEDSAGVLAQTPRSAASQNRPPAAAMATSHGTTGGEGPGANGLSQGRVRRMEAGIKNKNGIAPVLSLQVRAEVRPVQCSSRRTRLRLRVPKIQNYRDYSLHSCCTCCDWGDTSQKASQTVENRPI